MASQCLSPRAKSNTLNWWRSAKARSALTANRTRTSALRNSRPPRQRGLTPRSPRRSLRASTLISPHRSFLTSVPQSGAFGRMSSRCGSGFNRTSEGRRFDTGPLNVRMNSDPQGRSRWDSQGWRFCGSGFNRTLRRRLRGMVALVPGPCMSA